MEKEELPAYMISVSAAEIRKVGAISTIFYLSGQAFAYVLGLFLGDLSLPLLLFS